MWETACRSIELILVFISESHVRKRWIFMSFQSVREMTMLHDIIWQNSLFIEICSVFLSFVCLVESSYLRYFHKERERQRNWNFLGKQKNWVYMESSSTQIHQYHLCVSVYSRGRKNQYWSKFKVISNRRNESWQSNKRNMDTDVMKLYMIFLLEKNGDLTEEHTSNNISQDTAIRFSMIVMIFWWAVVSRVLEDIFVFSIDIDYTTIHSYKYFSLT